MINKLYRNMQDHHMNLFRLKSREIGILTCLLFISLVACSGTLRNAPAEEAGIDIRMWENKPGLIVGFGFGKSQQEAEKDAIAAVSRQVESRINTSFESTKREQVVDGESTLSEHFLQKVNITSSFEHAELIRVKGTKSTSTGFEAVAVLDRQEALLIIEKEYRDKAASFRHALTSAKQDSSSLDFSTSFQTVKELEPSVLKLGTQYRALAEYREQSPTRDRNLHNGQKQWNLPASSRATLEQIAADEKEYCRVVTLARERRSVGIIMSYEIGESTRTCTEDSENFEASLTDAI